MNAEKSFIESCFGPVDGKTYNGSAGWRWVSWGNWGRAERWTKFVAYTIGCLGPFYLGNPFQSNAGELPTLTLLAGWLLLILSPIQLLDVADRWLIRDKLSMAIMLPRVISHPLMGITLLNLEPSSGLNAVIMAYGGLLLIALWFEGMFLRNHLGKEHKRPDIDQAWIFWLFLSVYIAIYAIVFAAGLLA